MDKCDVLIVGGGPAGSTLAWSLRATGLEAAVMDKSEFPRNKVCAGWITPTVVESLRMDMADYTLGRVLQPIHGFRISQMGGGEVETRYDGRVVSYGIRRYEFDAYLLRRSAARLRLGESFQGMVRDGDTWVVNGAIRTRLVVGAGGHFCPVARAMGAKLGQAESVVAAQEIEFEMTPEQSAQCAVRADTPELYFCDDFKGYGWVFRKQGYLNIGLGREDNYKLSEHVQDFCAFLKERRRIPQDVPARFNGHAYLLYQHAQRPVQADGVLLVGDAAGLAYPQSGEGIRPAVESGLMAGEVIREARGDYRREQLSDYPARLKRRFGERDGQRGMAEHLPIWLKEALGRRLLATHWFTRHIVMDRWFLHADQAHLLSSLGP